MMKIGPAVAAAAVFAIVSPVCAQDAVQWRVEDGGNGHWYRRITRDARNWSTMKAYAEASGGHLTTVTSPHESAFLVSQVLAGYFCFIGGFQAPSAPEPVTDWRWTTGEPLVWSNWAVGEPNNYPGSLDEDCMAVWGDGRWADVNEDAFGTPCNHAVAEWSADCNSDGIVDYGQIRDGTFPDVNSNGVPDCCEPGESCLPCPGDVTKGGTVDAADLSILLAAWGTNGQGEFDTDLNGDGLVDGGDLALVLGGWGACP